MCVLSVLEVLMWNILRFLRWDGGYPIVLYTVIWNVLVPFQMCLCSIEKYYVEQIISLP